MLDKTFPHLFVYSTMCTFPLLFLITVNCSETFPFNGLLNIHDYQKQKYLPGNKNFNNPQSTHHYTDKEDL